MRRHHPALAAIHRQGRAACGVGSDLCGGGSHAPCWAKRVRRLELRGVSDMSEKSDPTRGEPLGSQANGSQSPPAEAHKVGPGSPPPDKRWKKGGPSPNPRGRPRKDQSMLPDVRKAFEQALNKKVAVPRGDKTVLMTRIEIGLEQLLNQFAKGDRHARRGPHGIRRQAGHRFFGQTQANPGAGAHPKLPSYPRCVFRTPKQRRKRGAGRACVGFVGTPR